MTSRRTILIIGVTGLLIGSLIPWRSLARPNTWQRMAEPGRLSAAHTSLQSRCSACHEPVTGATASRCIDCHAGEEHLLSRQSTAFHGEISDCRQCHREHRGLHAIPTTMDHAALGILGLDARRRDDPSLADQLARVARETSARTPLSSGEAALDCLSCHSNEDRHMSMFGNQCAACHGTERWSVDPFRHPRPRSVDCDECHRAPPSHNMGHFRMVSAEIACDPDARVDQCYRCHETNGWNDIKGVGLYKHH